MAIYAVDFDGTMCVDNYPHIGEVKQGVVDYIVAKQNAGHKIILWTCRTGEWLREAVEWCLEHGITFDAVNENLQERVEQYGGDCRKVSADYYIDDRAINVGFINAGSIKE